VPIPGKPATAYPRDGTKRARPADHVAAATIGGAPTCSVRLCAPGVRPFHCLVLRKDGQAIVRSLSSGNSLNGMPFHEALLRLGDVLRLGHLILKSWTTALRTR